MILQIGEREREREREREKEGFIANYNIIRFVWKNWHLKITTIKSKDHKSLVMDRKPWTKDALSLSAFQIFHQFSSEFILSELSLNSHYWISILMD